MALLVLCFIFSLLAFQNVVIATSSQESVQSNNRYGDSFKAFPGTTLKVSDQRKSLDLIPDDSFSLGYSNKFFGGHGLDGYGHYGFGAHGHGFGHGHLNHGFGHYNNYLGHPFGHHHHNHYFGHHHSPFFGGGYYNKHHVHYQGGYNYLFGGYPRFSFGLHHGHHF